MASSKDIQHSSRPSSQHTNSGSLPRHLHARTHSSSVASGSLISSHRVSRRKSVSSNASNVAVAVAAAMRDTSDSSAALPIAGRRGTMSKGSYARSVALGSLPSPPASLTNGRKQSKSGTRVDESAIEDDQMNDTDDGDDKEAVDAHIRRASDGQPLMDGKKAHSNDLKCKECGKGYKHSSCLSKHLWEHKPEWQLTSKLLISKHQQVQLLEAASVLLGMNKENTTPPGSAKDFQSDDQDSTSPISGSDEQDGISSADTTPPPDVFNTFGSSYSGRSKRYSSGHGFSQSYQSNNQFRAGSVSSNLGHHRQQSQESRPRSSGMNRNEEDGGLAAALALSNFGNLGARHPSSVGVEAEIEIPPVPPIPTEFLDFAEASSFAGPPRQTESYTRYGAPVDADTKMDGSEDSVADDEEDEQRYRGRSEEDVLVFGQMEE